MKRRIPISVMVLALAGTLAILPGSLSCAGKAEPITIGMESTAVNSLIYIAEDQDYFKANGLTATIRDNYPSGAAAADGMLKGEVDIATAAELAVVRQAFAKQSITTVATIDMFLHMKLTVRKDRGIQAPPDLRGKRIGVPTRSAADFMLGRFLDLNGIDSSQMTIVDVQAPKAVDALANGDVDAIVAWQPYVMTLEDRLGDKAGVWSVQSGQPMYCTVVTSNKLVSERPDLIRRFLKSLAQAEDFLIRNPARARAIVQQRLNYDDRYMNAIWPEHEFSLRLDQSLVTAMEDQARWMIKNNLTGETTIPNFVDYIHTESLEKLKPETVNIIR